MAIAVMIVDVPMSMWNIEITLLRLVVMHLPLVSTYCNIERDHHDTGANGENSEKGSISSLTIRVKYTWFHSQQTGKRW